jgi:hypothetical protein
MTPLARDLRSLGYDLTERDSPFHDDGRLWTNSYELICDKTGHVIRKAEQGESVDQDTDPASFERHEYYTSSRCRMMGGYASAYDWGYDNESFTYSNES